MKWSNRLAVFLVIVVILCGCGEKEPEVLQVTEVTFAKGLSEQMEPIEPTNAFGPGDTVYLSVKLKGNPKEGVVSARYLSMSQK